MLGCRPAVCGIVLSLGALASSSCHLVGPSCTEESGSVLSVDERVALGAIASFNVSSPKNSNLVMRLTWADTTATLAVRATITDCGQHVGCRMDTFTPAPGPGGPSPMQPWPAGVRELLVDGTRGKTYRVEVLGDPARDVAFTLSVNYRITCES